MVPPANGPLLKAITGRKTQAWIAEGHTWQTIYNEDNALLRKYKTLDEWEKKLPQGYNQMPIRTVFTYMDMGDPEVQNSFCASVAEQIETIDHPPEPICHACNTLRMKDEKAK